MSTDNLSRHLAHLRLSEALESVEDVFVPGTNLGLLARNPHSPDRHMFVSTLSWSEAVQALAETAVSNGMQVSETLRTLADELDEGAALGGDALTRPDAPLIEATAELLGSVKSPWYGVALYRYCTTPCFPVRGLGDEPMYDVRDESRICNVPASSLLLDLRIPEVQDRFLRVLWARVGMPSIPWSPELVRCPDGVWSLGANHPDQLNAPGEVLIYTFGPEGHDPPVDQVVLALANLPTTDTLAWACWHIEQALRAEETR